jgi:diphthine-ammonia ligase
VEGTSIESKAEAISQERQYGSHPAGEGGEYETLTLSTPLFSHRLQLLKTSTVITDPEPYPVAYLRVEEAELVEKGGWARPTVQELRRLLGLDEGTDGLDEKGRERLEELGEAQVIERKNGEASETTPNLDALSLGAEIDGDAPEGLEVRFGSRGRWFTASVTGQTRGEEPVGQELRRSFDAISSEYSYSISTRYTMLTPIAELTSRGLSLPLHAAHITLLLSSISLFAPANEVYKTFFGTSPPSRATVAVKLPPGERVRLEVVGFDDRPDNEGKGWQVDKGPDSQERDVLGEGAGVKLVGGRQALHVQGLSYWAPANIGPYSQAVIVSARGATTHPYQSDRSNHSAPPCSRFPMKYRLPRSATLR